MDKINENLDLINSLVEELKEQFKRKIQSKDNKIKSLKWQVKEIDRSRWIWYKKCQEYEKILFENKIPYNDLPF